MFSTTVSSRSVTNHSSVSDLLNEASSGTTSSASSLSPLEEDIQRLTDTWRTLPSLNPTIEFKSWIIPKGRSLQKIVQDPLIQPYLASRHGLLEHTHGRVKVIRDFPVEDADDDDLAKTCKLVLLHPDAPSWDDIPSTIRDILSDGKGDGPMVPVSFAFYNFTASYILQNVLPLDVHPPPTAFETIGHVAHFNLRAPHVPYRYLIGQILLETLPTIETVIHKVGEVQGPYRVYDLEVLAGRPETQVQLIESGVNLRFNVEDVYWCSRLSEERQRLLRTEIRSGQWVADAFCGVGALVLQAAKHMDCRITANDWNPAAVEALRANVEQNGVTDKFDDIRCGDAYEFLMDLGGGSGSSSEGQQLPDHIHMNYPLEAPSFLGALRWWPVPRKRQQKQSGRRPPRIHVYTFARADADETHRTAEECAVDLIAEELLPMGPRVTHRWEELNDDYGCDLRVHHVRDVAPGKLVLCVSFTATDKLLRYMQGDFS